MSESPCHIGVFISASSINVEFNELIQKRKDYFYRADEVLEDAIEVGKNFEKRGVEIIIARRGTSQLLRENLTIPVLSLPQSSLSIINVVHQAASRIQDRGYEKVRIFMPNFRAGISGLEILNKLLPIEFRQGVYHDTESLKELIFRAAEEGFQGVIGGTATKRFAESHNLFYQELVTTHEEIMETVDNACSVTIANRREKVGRLRYQTVNDMVAEGIISMNEEKRIITLNKKARKILNLKDQLVTGRSASSLFKEGPIKRAISRGKSVQDRIEKINGELYVFNQEPVFFADRTAGFVATFRDASAVMKTENKVRRKMSRGFVARYEIDDILHQSQAMSKLVENIKEISRTNSTVLIQGETGTGKELVAQSIHNCSSRKRNPFVTINCGALPESLLESELFGYEEGAFTGSKKGGKAGLFELAHQGTLFLDEIDSTPKTVQIRLLRVLQEKEVMRIGGDQTIPIDVRIITASGSGLWEATQRGIFRRDLFFRLNVLRINVPPLRNRREDIALLFTHFLYQHANTHHLIIPSLPPEHMTRLQNYRWPGNVRQLRNFAEQLLLSTSFGNPVENIALRFLELEAIMDMQNSKDLPSGPSAKGIETEQHPLSFPQEQIAPSASGMLHHPENEKGKILHALQQCRYNREKTALMLGVSRTTLWRKMKNYGLDRT